MTADKTKSEEIDGPVQLEITLKSGAQLLVDATDWKLVRGITQESLEVETPEDGNRRLVHIALGEVAAIVEIRS